MLHHDEVSVVIATNLVDGNDPRMIESSNRPSLLAQSVRRLFLGVSILGMEDLDGDISIKFGVAGEKH